MNFAASLPPGSALDVTVTFRPTLERTVALDVTLTLTVISWLLPGASEGCDTCRRPPPP